MSYSNRQSPRRGSSLSSGWKLRLLLAGGILLFSVVTFFSKGQSNPITGKTQWVDMTVKEEILMGLQSAPQMGTPSRDREGQAMVQQIGYQLVSSLNQDLQRRGLDNPYQFDFTLLADRQTVNAFALPGGQVFVTEALFYQLTPAQVAGVLGHEVGHVIERHGSERMAKGNLINGLVNAAGVAGGSADGSRLASYVGNIVHMRYGRQDELESDKWGVLLMVLSGYDPNEMMAVMDVLEKNGAGGGKPEFMSSHPRPANRRQYIKEIIAQLPAEARTGLRSN